MKTFYTCLLLIMLLTSCDEEGFPVAGSQAKRAFAEAMKKKYDLQPSGFGASMPGEKIKWLFLAFDSEQALDLRAARKLFVDVTEEFVARMNQDENLRPYLEDYPATFKNAHIELIFHNKDGNYYDDGKIAFISYVEKKHVGEDGIAGNICYRIGNPTTSTKFETIHREPYEQALKIVRGEMADPYVPR